MKFLNLYLLLIICVLSTYANGSIPLQSERTSYSQELSDTVTVKLDIPLVKLKNDTVILIAATDLFPYLENLNPNVNKVIRASRESDGSAYYYRFVSPMEYGAIENSGIKSCRSIIGFVMFEDIFILLDTSFLSLIKSSEGNFNLKLCIQKDPEFISNYDPWERIYILNNNLVYRLGRCFDNQEAAIVEAEYVKKILDSMSYHLLPDVPATKIYR